MKLSDATNEIMGALLSGKLEELSKTFDELTALSDGTNLMIQLDNSENTIENDMDIESKISDYPYKTGESYSITVRNLNPSQKLKSKAWVMTKIVHLT